MEEALTIIVKILLLNNLREIVEISQAVATIFAMVVGGFWGYMLFVTKRQKYPRANIIHQVSYKPISDGKALLNVTVIIHNTGDVLLSILSAEIKLKQVLPLPEEIKKAISENEELVKNGETEVEWPEIIKRNISWPEGEFEIEPGEKDQVLCDFIVEDKYESVIFYSYFKNVSKPGREIGWELSNLFDLKRK